MNVIFDRIRLKWLPRGVLRGLLASILVAASATTLAQGFGDKYVVQIGDVGADGDADIHLRPVSDLVFVQLDGLSTPIKTEREYHARFFLENQGDGTFAVAPLTGAQYSAASWQDVDVTVLVNDYSLDGIKDLMLTGISAYINGADAQLVFATPVKNTLPAHLRAVDATVRNFFNDIAGWINAPLVTESGFFPEYEYLGFTLTLQFDQGGVLIKPSVCFLYYACGPLFLDDQSDPGGWFPGNDPNSPDVYHWWGWDLVYKTITYRDYTVTEPNATIVTQVLEDQWESGTLPDDSFPADVLETYYEVIFGAPVVDLEIEPPVDLNVELEDDWHWTRVIATLLWTSVSVCTDSENALDCLVEGTAPGIPLAVCQTQGPFDYDITQAQQAMVDNLQRRDFWVSRYTDSCDPFSPSALSVVDEVGLGAVTMAWFRKVAESRGLTIDETEVGYDIMRAHAQTTKDDTINIDHLLSKSQISDYHFDVFEEYGMPDYAFGGSPTGGGLWEATLGALFWCIGCDELPKR